MDIRQLRHDQADKQKLDLERTVSHMYDLPLRRRRCGRSCLWNTCTWSPKSSRRVVGCGTPVFWSLKSCRRVVSCGIPVFGR